MDSEDGGDEGEGRIPVRDTVGAPPGVVLSDERRGIGVDQADPPVGTDVVGGRGPVGWTGFCPKCHLKHRRKKYYRHRQNNKHMQNYKNIAFQKTGMIIAKLR